MFACVDCANPHTLRSGDKMKLGDVADFIRNGVTISQNKDKNGLPITRIETIADRTINLDKCGYAGLRENDYSEYALQKGDILISHINSEKHLGKCAYFDLDDKVIHGMNLLCFRNKNDLSDSKYLFHFLPSSAFVKQIPKITKQVLVFHNLGIWMFICPIFLPKPKLQKSSINRPLLLLNARHRLRSWMCWCSRCFIICFWQIKNINS